MTGPVKLSPLAARDLEQIWDYTANQFGIAQAEGYTRQLWRAMEDIAARPLIGQACPEIRAGYHRYRSGSHVLFYVVAEDDVTLIRILHQRMDVERQFRLS
jgi:toxin ParE1/3/4